MTGQPESSKSGSGNNNVWTNAPWKSQEIGMNKGDEGILYLSMVYCSLFNGYTSSEDIKIQPPVNQPSTLKPLREYLRQPAEAPSSL
jgi:hypothetical protein